MNGLFRLGTKTQFEFPPRCLSFIFAATWLRACFFAALVTMQVGNYVLFRRQLSLSLSIYIYYQKDLNVVYLFHCMTKVCHVFTYI